MLELLHFFDHVNVERRVGLLTQRLEVGEYRVLRARAERSFQEAFKAGQAVRVVGQAEVTKGRL